MSSRVFCRLISLVLCLQIALPLQVLQPYAHAQSASDPSSDPASDSGPIDSLPITPDSAPVPEKLDVFRLLDQYVPSVQGGQSNPAVPLSKIRLRPHADGSLELFAGKYNLLKLDFKVQSPLVLGGQYLVWLDVGAQEIQFLDLQTFSKNIGQTAVPVFRIKTLPSTPLHELTLAFEDGRFLIQAGEHRLGAEIFKFYSELQQVAFRFTANLVDPDSYSDLGELLSDFDDYFERATELASDGLIQQIENVDANPIKGHTIASDLRSRLQTIQELQESAQLKSAIAGVQRQTEVERKLGARIGLLWKRLTLPNRDAPTKIAQALVMVRAGLFKDGLKSLLNRPAVKYGVPLAAAAVLGASYPESVIHYLYQSLDLTRTIVDVFLTKSQNIGTLATEATHSSLGWILHPGTIYDAYFTPQKLPKFLVGLSSIVGTLYVTLGLPHLITNTVAMVKELKAADFSIEARQGTSRIAHFKKWFIEREKKRKSDYLELLSAAEAQRTTGGKHADFNAEDEAEVDRLLTELGASQSSTTDEIDLQNRSWKQKFIEPIKSWPIVKKFFHKSDSQITTFRQALGHFLVGYASLTLSGFTYSKIWNSWFAFRSFIYKPSIWITYLMYPKFIGTALRDASQTKGADLIVPSKWNGGTRSWAESLLNRWKGRSDTAREQLATLRAWEDKVISVEAAIRESALKRSYQAMIPWMQNHDQLKAWMESRPENAVLSPEQLDILTREQRLVFRLYSEALFDTAMQNFLKELNADQGSSTSVDLDLTPAQLKEISLSQLENLKIENADAVRLVEEATEQGALFERIQAQAKQNLIASSTQAAKIALRDRMISQIDPDQNRQISRLMAVERQMGNPLAMSRAIRSMIATNLVNKPMELVLTFLCFAAITEGFLMPIQDQMFGSDSWFYLSKYVFGTGYLSGVITGVLADTWMKLQQDELHNDNFGEVPQGADAKRGFMSWWYKKTFKDPNNAWWRNHKHMLGIIWANMPAALVMIMTTNLLTLGRFDLDVYMMGYLLTYALPLTGFNVKIEQGFELASYYDLKDFPERLRSHPKVLDYFNHKVTKRRMIFNVFCKFYEDILGYFMTSFSHMTTPEFGTRSLSRILFGGLTPTEWAYLGLTKIDDLFGWAPAVKGFTHACASLLTTNYTGSKIIPAPTPGK